MRWCSLLRGRRWWPAKDTRIAQAGGRAEGDDENLWSTLSVAFAVFHHHTPAPRGRAQRTTALAQSSPGFGFDQWTATPRLASRLLLLPASANAPLRARSARAPCGGSPDGRRPPSTSTRTTSSTVRFGCKYGLIVETRATLWSSQIRVRLKEVLAAAIFLNSLDYHLDFENI